MTPDPMAIASAPTAGGFLLVLSLVVPLIGLVLSFAPGGRQGHRVVLATLPFGLAVAVAIVFAYHRGGTPLVYTLGGWAPPLGVALRADGLSVVMIALTAVVMGAVAVYAQADFATPTGAAERRGPFAFWILLLAIWTALNLVFVAGDLFTLYVGLELLTFAAVPVVCLDGRPDTLRAALRYLLFALLGSIFYLAGAALLYGMHGTFDVALLASRVRAEPVALIAAALMTAGLIAKTALFPLHMWLPPAHAGAPPAGSAVLSALVVKGSLFIIVRLWFGVMPGVIGGLAPQVMGVLGAAAIVLGSVVALRQERLKLLIAYSTLAQIGFLFLMFPLAAGVDGIVPGVALAGGMVQVVAHATAKAAMFMAAGTIYACLGHDRIGDLGGAVRAVPLSLLAFVLGGVALIGIPLSGADLAKTIWLQAAADTGQWWWQAVIKTSGVFTSSYLLLVVAHVMSWGAAPVAAQAPGRRWQGTVAVTMALCSLLLGFVPWSAVLVLPPGPASQPTVITAVAGALWPLLGGGVLALLVAPSGRSRVLALPWLGAVRRLPGGAADGLVRVDGALREWPVASLSLVLLTILFGAALLGGR